MTDSEFEHFAEEVLSMVSPELIIMAEVEGQMAGFALVLPDFNEAMRPLNGQLFTWGLPLGYLQFRRNCRKIKTGRLLALGVLEKYRRRGITEMLILKALVNGRDVAHFTQAELGWTLEDNVVINKAIETSGGSRYKTYRIYHKELTAK